MLTCSLLGSNVAVALAVAVAAVPLRAKAQKYNWSYTLTGGATGSGSGTFSASGPGLPATITGATGTISGAGGNVAVTSVAPADGDNGGDNKILAIGSCDGSMSCNVIDGNGFTLMLADGADIKFYSAGRGVAVLLHGGFFTADFTISKHTGK